MLRSIRRPVMACAIAAALVSAGCDSGETPTGPTTPGGNPATVTQTFSGTVTPNGSLHFSFGTGGAGEVRAAITQIAPDENSVLSLSLGVWTGTACQIVIENANATRGVQITGNVSQVGNLCARVADVGKLSAPATFEVTVVHP